MPHRSRARASALALLLLTVSLATPLRAADAPKAEGTKPPAANFAGTWETTYGLMQLEQKADAVTGFYGPPEQRNAITGTVKDGKLTFTYVEPNAIGEGSFELAPDGKSFAGKWRQNRFGPDWHSWQGKRAVKPAETEKDFAGLWATRFGKMRLRQTGGTVHGVYAFAGGSTVKGTLDPKDKKTVRFTYTEPTGETGEGAFTLSDDAKSFTGSWKDDAGNGGKDWTGARIPREPGKTWLVVLEAPWEGGLADAEYSFGDMLRAFFSRTPQVKVRHRFFHDEADLRRWCAELAYLAEPVVLHISSHGTEKGITVGRDVINGKTLADCLKHAGDIKLLHLGTCLAMDGSLPKDLCTALAPAGHHFPVSGYSKVADWGGSAVVDFTYLELIFSRGQTPSEAVKQVREMVSFAGDRAGSGNAASIAPSGLVIYEPD